MSVTFNPFTGSFDFEGAAPTGPINTPAYFDATGALANIPSWGVNEWFGTNSYSTVNTPVDAGDVYAKIYGVEIEINPVQNTAQFHPNGFGRDVHYDRTGSGFNTNDVSHTNENFSFEGSGHVNNWNHHNYSQNLGNGFGGSADFVYALNNFTSVNSGFEITSTYTGLGHSANIAAGALVNAPFFHTNLFSSGNMGNNLYGVNFGHNGNVAADAQFFSGSINGNIGGNAILSNLFYNGSVGGSLTGYAMSLTGGPYTGQVWGTNLVFANSNAAGKVGHSLLMGSGTMNGGRFAEFNFQDGIYNDKIGLNLNMGQGAGYSQFETGVNVSQNGGGSAINFQGINIQGATGSTTQNWNGLVISSNTATGTNQTRGINVDFNNAPELTLPNRKMCADFQGGQFQTAYLTKSISNHPFTVDQLNQMAGGFTIDLGAPITGTDLAGNVLAYQLGAFDNMGTSAIGLGAVNTIWEAFIGVDAGKTVDKFTLQTCVPILAGASFGLPNGGTFAEMNYSRMYAPFSLGGTATITDLYVFKADSGVGPFSGMATNAYGIYLDDAGFKNYLGGKTRVGGASFAPPADTLEVAGGNIAAMDAGYGLKIKEGANSKMGVAVLVGGTITVANTSVTASSRIFVSTNIPGGVTGAVYASNILPGTSFDISSTSILDTSTVSWLIVEPS